VLGLVNVRGELVVCVSLARLLDTGSLPAPLPSRSQSSKRVRRHLLVVRHGEIRAVFPADEVHGIRRFDRRELIDPPATIAKCGATHTTALLAWDDRSVGVLDVERVFSTLERSLRE
jgi:chemotaxis-related protein WspD